MTTRHHARYQYVGTTVERGATTPPATGYGITFFDTDLGIEYFWDGAAWVGGGAGGVHNALAGLQGGVAGEYYHLTAAQHTAVGLMVTAGLDALTAAEVDQLENIGATTISAAQWGYLGAMNQGVATTDSPTFANVYVPDGGFIGVNAGVGWLFDNTNGDISTTANVGINETEPERLLHITTAGYDEGILVESTHETIPLPGGPRIELFTNSGSPAADDFLGLIEFSGRDSTDAKTDYAAIGALITSPTNTLERGMLMFYTTNATLTPRVQITYAGTLEPFGATGALGETGHLWNVNATYVSLPDTGWIGIPGNELLTVNAAGNFTFSGVTSVVVPDGARVGADAACSWLFNSTNGYVTVQDKVGIGASQPQEMLTIKHSGKIAWEYSAGIPASSFHRIHVNTSQDMRFEVYPTTITTFQAFTFYGSATAGLPDRLLVMITNGAGVGIGVVPSTRLDIDAGALEMAEMAAPGAGAANTCRLYCVDVGGKTTLYAIFNTGAAQLVAQQP